MRTLLTFATLAVAALCVCAAPQARSFSEEMDARMSPRSMYPMPMPPPPPPPPSPFFHDMQYGKPPPPPFDDMRPHHDDDDGHCTIRRVIGWIVEAVAKLFGFNYDRNNGDFDLGKFWDRLTSDWNGPTTTYSPVTWSWMSPPTPAPPTIFWGNMSAPQPWVSGRPNFTHNFPSSPSMPPSSSSIREGRPRPSGTGTSSGGASGMGFPSTGGNILSDPVPMYDTVQKSEAIMKYPTLRPPMMLPERAKPMPMSMNSMQSMSGMQMQGMQANNMQMQGMEMASQAKAGATPVKPMVAIGAVAGTATIPKPVVPVKPVAPAVAAVKPVAPVPVKPVAPVPVKPAVAPAAVKPVAPTAVKPPVMQAMRGR